MNEEQEVNTEDESLEDAAFEAGFNDEEIEGIVEEPKAIEAEVEPAEVESEEVVAEVAEESRPSLIAGMTEDEIKAALQNASELEKKFYAMHDKVYGRLGDIGNRLDSIPKRVVNNISPKARERMIEEFPELAEILFSEPGEEEPEVEAKEVKVAAESVEVDVEKRIADALTTTTRNFEHKLLTRDHPNYATVARTPEFGEFSKTLSQEDQVKLRDTWDSTFLSKVLTDHSTWLAEKQDSDKSKAELAAEKKKRLQSAITPRGHTQVSLENTDDEEAAMLAGFNS